VAGWQVERWFCGRHGVKTDDELLRRLRELCGDEAIRLEKQAPGM